MEPIKLDASVPDQCDGVHLTLKQLLFYKDQTVQWLPPAQNVWQSLSGLHNSSIKGRGLNFSEVRQYQPGDDIRTIDWRVTARTNKVHTKLFTEERERTTLIFIDFSRSMFFGSQLLLKSVQAAHVAALLSWLAVAQQDKVGLVVALGDRIIHCPPTARDQGALRLINTLIQYHPQSSNTLQSAMVNFDLVFKELYQLCPKGSDLILISDFYQLEEKHRRLMMPLAQHNNLHLVQIVDPLELGQTNFKGSEWVSDYQRSAHLNFGSKKTKKLMQDAFLQHQSYLKQFTTDLALPLYTLSASAYLLTQFQQSVNRGGL